MTEQERAEKQKTIMADIWKTLPKEANLPPGLTGDYIRYASTDPKYLYWSGFVDAVKYTFEEWEAAFQDVKEADGNYLISKEKFLSLSKFKFVGIVKRPLDVMELREGWYDLQKWHEFCVNSILTSTTFTLDNLIEAEKKMKESGGIVDNRILVDKQFKLRLKTVIDNFPSPARVRELAVEEAYQNSVKKAAGQAKELAVQSSYEKGKKVGDKEKKNLSETLLKSSKVAQVQKDESTLLSIKDLRKGARGKR